MSQKFFRLFVSLMIALALSIVGFVPALAASPVNDNFADAISITSLPFSTAVDISEAGIEPSEPQFCYPPQKTVWYSYTPTTNAVVRMDRLGSSFSDTNFTVYQDTGSGIGGLSFLECAYYDNSVTFNVQAGVTYYIQAGSIQSVSGDLQLNLQEVIRPANDNFANAEIIDILPFSATVNNIDAMTEVGEPQQCDASPNTLWYSFTPTANSTVRVDMAGSSFSDTTFHIYQDTDSGIGGLSFLTCASFGDSTNFNAQAGVTYYIQAGSNESSGGELQLNLQEVFPPQNDNFNNATIIGGLPFSAVIDITNATNIGEPSPCYYFMERTIWYSFTPNETIGVRADTLGTALNRNLNIYRSTGPGISDLSFLNCAVENGSFSFVAEAGQTYYLQAGTVFDEAGTIQINLQQIPTPANDNFVNAMVVPSLPFDDTIAEIGAASAQVGEPRPSCAGSGLNGTVWYAFTPAASGSISSSVSAPIFTYTLLAAYSGNSMTSLTELGCRGPYGGVLTFHVDAGSTYYFQAGNYFSTNIGSIQFHLDVTPQPVASFYSYPSDPSIYDTVQFYDGSSDPGQVGFDSFTWKFGDGSTATGASPTHKYAKDGDYTVQHSATTVDGRTASVSQIVHVKTHDVAITKLNAPQSASAKQTRTITVSVNSKSYAETVQIDLYRSVAGGFEYVGSVTQLVPASSSKKTVTFSFNYTFTSSDASIGKLTFKAVATIVDARDSYPSDNEAISSPPTKVTK